MFARPELPNSNVFLVVRLIISFMNAESVKRSDVLTEEIMVQLWRSARREKESISTDEYALRRNSLIAVSFPFHLSIASQSQKMHTPA